jgi:hypothetical protein
MGSFRLRSLPWTARVAASAFGIHALLLLVDLAVLGSTYLGGREDANLRYVLRITAFCLFALSLLQGPFKSKPWLTGIIACAAFLLSDMMRLDEIFAGPALGNAPTLVASALLLSLLVGIGASLWTDASTFLRNLLPS